MPQIVKLQNSLTVDGVQESINKKYIKIVATSIPNNATDVKPGEHALTITFDKPMTIGNNGTGYGKRGKQYFPEIITEKANIWNMETKKEWTIYLNLMPDKEYSIALPAQFFMGENGEPIAETCFLDFKTAKQ